LCRTVFLCGEHRQVRRALSRQARLRVRSVLGRPAAYFWIRDADALFDEFEKNGVEVVYEPKIIELYTMKEFAVRDLNGYVLAFGQDWPAAAKA
jgi:hypothetical protein